MISHINSHPLGKSQRLNDEVGSNLEMFITTSMISGKKTVNEFLSHRLGYDDEAYFIDVTEKKSKSWGLRRLC